MNVQRFAPVLLNTTGLVHGGDYNPDQWLDRPDILAEDIRLMKLAGVTAVSVGIFAWATYEPEEGRFEFKWMDDLLDRLHANGIRAILATPTGAKPNWMAVKYPEIRRVDAKGHRDPQWGRHNHCYTSPVYREKTRILNAKLAERYSNHPAVAMWHISNEYGGECHCDLCKQAFRDFLKVRYGTLTELNNAYWSAFWSHTYTDWTQIGPIDASVHGLVLDWRRFVSHQTCDFMLHEIKPLRAAGTTIPVTINMMGFFDTLDYWKFAPHIDCVTWDAYPGWHNEDTQLTSAWIAFVGDAYRAMKAGKPWLLMESTPSNVNWQDVSPLKRPGVNRLASLLTVAHGSDSVMYFQFRKGRGGMEKFHGAIVDHEGSEHTRVFKEVAALGAELKTFTPIVGTTTPAEVAVIYDWENNWAINASQGPRNVGKAHMATVQSFHEPLWKRGVAVDVIDSEQPLGNYRLVIAPMLYMLKPGVADKLAAFVRRGGTLITTYLTGYVNESDLCFLGGFPGGKHSEFRRAVGVWAEEIDALIDAKKNSIHMAPGNSLGLSGSYEASQYFELIHAETAQAAGTYTSDFYAGRPAVTVNSFGPGRAIHIAARMERRFNEDLLAGLIEKLKLPRAIHTDLPAGVIATYRTDGQRKFVFLLNLTSEPRSVPVPAGHTTLAGTPVPASLDLPSYDVQILVGPWETKA